MTHEEVPISLRRVTNGPDPSLGEFDRLGWPQPANNVLSKSQVREAQRQHNLPKLRELWDAQMSKALGVKHLVMRHEDGTFTRITDKPVEEIDAMLKSGVAIEIWARDPDHKAIEDILNRSQDKPKEQEQTVVLHDGDRIREKLDAWKRAHREPDAADR